MTEQNPDLAVKSISNSANYDKYPYINVSDRPTDCAVGWEAIIRKLKSQLSIDQRPNKILVIDTYQGVIDQDLLPGIIAGLSPSLIVNTATLLKDEAEVRRLIDPHLGNHPIFGRMNNLQLTDFFSQDKWRSAINDLKRQNGDLTLIYGVGASLLSENPSLRIYADMARWEIQQRFRSNLVGNLGRKNEDESASAKYKQAYFIDWRVCDKHKKANLVKCDFILDSNDRSNPKMISNELLNQGLDKAIKQPFRVVPFFDPGVWGGQWMKEVCGLDQNEVNYAWCFDCVPEENSLLLGFGDHRIEIPAINLVFFRSIPLLGEMTFNRFGAEFPIRFDFLDTMGGGNLSLQVHPKAAYMKEHFGLDYTQDESYYFLDAAADAMVYLGLREDLDREKMISDLQEAQSGGGRFLAEKYVNIFPVKKHDHVLIPAGTIHCSGRNSMVLEISATPYIFTFKLWDWGRVDLDGKPRTISLDHGRKNIDWRRTTENVKKELINTITPIDQGNGFREESTGLHESEFIETRRHWFTKSVLHNSNGNLNVLNLVQGREVIVESPLDAFSPFIVHYAETFIVPASVGQYTIRPHGDAIGEECATLKAFVRS